MHDVIAVKVEVANGSARYFITVARLCPLGHPRHLGMQGVSRRLG
jgi:hypothetical protein